MLRCRTHLALAKSYRLSGPHGRPRDLSPRSSERPLLFTSAEKTDAKDEIRYRHGKSAPAPGHSQIR
jgi:hypothetical protein